MICATQLAGGVLLKKLKYFEVMLNIFEFSRVWEIVESWANNFSWIVESYFLTEKDFLWKESFLQSGIVLTVIISCVVRKIAN